MTANMEEVKIKVHTYIDLLDEHFLKVVYAMLDTHLKAKEEASIIGYDMDGQTKYAEDMETIYDAEVEAALTEEAYLTTTELREKAQTWLKNTK